MFGRYVTSLEYQKKLRDSINHIGFRFRDIDELNKCRKKIMYYKEYDVDYRIYIDF